MKKYIIIILLSALSSSDLDNLSFGSDTSLDIATWNIEWFPKNGYTTIDYATQIIENLEFDIIAIQELSDTLLFDQMIDALDIYTGYYQSSWFAGLGFIYNNQTVEVNDIYEIYTTYQYWSPFPRSPMVLDFNFDGQRYIIINNHFKCCGNGDFESSDAGDEETRRYIASNLLKEYVDTYFSNTNVIILGDLNDDIAEPESNNIFMNIISDSENYLFTDMEIAEGTSSDWSFPNWPSHLDHILITDELFGLFADPQSEVRTIKVDNYMDGGFDSYDDNISDHRPVALKLYMGSQYDLGDVNNDGQINIVDIVQVIGFVIDMTYSPNADMDENGLINILDIVIIIDIILSSDIEQ